VRMFCQIRIQPIAVRTPRRFKF